MKRLSILGSTGSIGMQALEVVRAHPDAFQVVAVAAGRRLDLLTEQILEFRPHLVSVGSLQGAEELRERLRGLPVKICFGEEGLAEVAAYSEAELCLLAVVGAAGLTPALAAIRAGKDVALATKEALVMAGALLTAEAAARGVKLLPVDSDHSAIFQGSHEPADGRGCGGHGCVGVRDSGQAEVEDLRLIALGHENVGRLEVAVDDAAQVGVMDGFANSSKELQSPGAG